MLAFRNSINSAQAVTFQSLNESILIKQKPLIMKKKVFSVSFCSALILFTTLVTATDAISASESFVAFFCANAFCEKCR